MITIAIDPGANGGIARKDGDSVSCWPMPETLGDLADFLSGLKLFDQVQAVVEQTGGYMPGNSGPASVKFARHCGQIEGLLQGFGIPYRQVAPKTWQNGMGLPADKAERKRAIKAAMQARYPWLTVTLATADALAILTWALDGGKSTPSPAAKIASKASRMPGEAKTTQSAGRRTGKTAQGNVEGVKV